MAHRYFAEILEDGRHARITGPDAEHLGRVLRARRGEKIVLCDGKGADYTGRILALENGEICLEIVDKTPSATEPDIVVHVYLGITKADRLEWAIQKCVELGCAALTPFYSSFSVVKPKREEEKVERYNRIAREAAKQSNRGIIPHVFSPINYTQMMAEAGEQDLFLLCYEGGGASLSELAAEAPLPGKRIGLATGPEGGFSAMEYRQAITAGCRAVSLGPRILRSETAPVAALSALMVLSGNM